ncbi:MAG: ABC transporter ATP-binding protein [Planctomycetota bacterium]|nr:MAG: ABC transporter ATP-binding protein [Planctomycetota bacterium]
MNQEVPGGAPAAPRLTLRALRYAYPGRPGPALQDLSLEVSPGEFVAVLGSNGSGKSTLLALVAGQRHPSGGEVLLDGKPLRSRPPAAFARRVGFLPARPRIPPDVTAREVVVVGRHPHGRGLFLERPEDLARADRALEDCGALEFADRPCEELSSGERQRVLLARLFCQDPCLLLLDEPTSAQDPAHALDVFARLAQRCQRRRHTAIVACHDLNTAARYADRIVLLRSGRLVASGPPAEVVTPEILARAFDVDAIVGSDGAVPYAVARGRRT